MQKGGTQDPKRALMDVFFFLSFSGIDEWLRGNKLFLSLSFLSLSSGKGTNVHHLLLGGGGGGGGTTFAHLHIPLSNGEKKNGNPSKEEEEERRPLSVMELSERRRRLKRERRSGYSFGAFRCARFTGAIIVARNGEIECPVETSRDPRPCLTGTDDGKPV